MYNFINDHQLYGRYEKKKNLTIQKFFLSRNLAFLKDLHYKLMVLLYSNVKEKTQYWIVESRKFYIVKRLLSRKIKV